MVNFFHKKKESIAWFLNCQFNKETQDLLIFDSYHYAETNIFLMEPMAFAGFSPFGHALVQFIIVWHLNSF